MHGIDITTVRQYEEPKTEARPAGSLWQLGQRVQQQAQHGVDGPARRRGALVARRGQAVRGQHLLSSAEHSGRGLCHTCLMKLSTSVPNGAPASRLARPAAHPVPEFRRDPCPPWTRPQGPGPGRARRPGRRAPEAARTRTTARIAGPARGRGQVRGTRQGQPLSLADLLTGRAQQRESVGQQGRLRRPGLDKVNQR